MDAWSYNEERQQPWASGAEPSPYQEQPLDSWNLPEFPYDDERQSHGGGAFFSDSKADDSRGAPAWARNEQPYPDIGKADAPKLAITTSGRWSNDDNMLNRGSVGTAPSAASWDSDTSTKDDAYSVDDSSPYGGERRGKKHKGPAPEKENKRLKKNAREQRRANKINDQIAHMKCLLESAGLHVLPTKSAILCEAINLLQVLLRPMQQNGGLGNLGHYGPPSQQQNEPYCMLFQKSATPLAIATADGTGRLLDCNIRFAEIFGTTVEELKLRNAYELSSKEDLERTSGVLTSLAKAPVAEHFNSDVILVTKLGTRLLVKVSALRDDDQRPRYMLFTPKALLNRRSGVTTSSAL